MPINEFCARDCVWDSTNQVEYDNACRDCWASRVKLIQPAIWAICGKNEGQIIGEVDNQFVFRENGVNFTVSKSSVRKV